MPSAAQLLQQAHPFDHHAAVNGLAHVIDGQRRDAGSGQRFHFHARLPRQLAYRSDQDAVFAIGRSSTLMLVSSSG